VFLRTVLRGALSAMLAVLIGPAVAEVYPDKPVRMVVPFPAGGPTDVLARLIAQKLTEKWKQPVLVDNRPGAGANIGAEIVAKSKPDGYTLLMTTSALAVAPSLYPKLNYDPLKDLSPVVNVAYAPFLLVVRPEMPAKSVQELIALARSQPGQIMFASTGSGTPLHLAGELFKTMAGIDIVHVPYKGSAPALTDLLGGQVQMMFDSPITSLPLVRGGKLRALGISSATRSLVALEIPTIAEGGVPGYEGALWYGLLVPTGVDSSIVNSINRDVVAIIGQPEVRARFVDLGADPVGNQVEQFKSEIERDARKWAIIVRKSGATVQ